jgi:ankyrin repeat protein
MTQFNTQNLRNGLTPLLRLKSPFTNFINALAQNAPIGEIEKLIQQLCGNSEINVEDSLGKTPLMHAVLNHRGDVAGLLLKYGAEVDSQNVTFSVPDDTPLQVVGASSQNPGPQEF